MSNNHTDAARETPTNDRMRYFLSANIDWQMSWQGEELFYVWHHRNGYQHSPKAVEGFIHHKEQGQVARLNHIF